jgi:ribosomal protein S18 acetylase RimI-like enzyme
MTIRLRSAVQADLLSVLGLWEAADAEPTHTDDIDSLRALLQQDPDSLVVAELDGQLVGSVIAAWDGWRGSIYRLAVAPSARHRGLGRRLLSNAQARLDGLGARRLQATVVQNDDQAMAFWRASGWEEQSQRCRFVHG